MCSMAEQKRFSNEQRVFTANLSLIQQTLAQAGVQYSLVGGMAIKAITEGDIPARRSNGTIYDFDAVAFGPDTQTIKRVLDQLAPHTAKPLFPEMGLESSPIGLSINPNGSTGLEMLSSMRVDDGKFFLVYKDIEEEVPPETVAVKTRLLNGIPFPCFPAKTILFRYLTRGGVMKPKDDEKLRKFEDYIVAHWDEEPDDLLYRPYLAFAERVRERYPRSISLFDAFWTFDHAIGDRISGSKGFFYSLIPLFRK